jgi:CubicO group peptidase (beta-lactamase class C family)
MSLEWRLSNRYGNGWVGWTGERGVRYWCDRDNHWVIDYTTNGGMYWQNDLVSFEGTAEEARDRAVAYLIGERISE